MSALPKLKIRSPFQFAQGIYGLEQAKDILFNYSDVTMVIVEGQRIYSYEQLIRLATQDCYRHKDFLEVIVLPTLATGG